MTDPRRTASNDDLAEFDAPNSSQGGSSGGDLQREIGALDEEKLATDADPQPISVHKGQRPHGGEPTLPNRQQTHDGQDKAPPRRT